MKKFILFLSVFLILITLSTFNPKNFKINNKFFAVKNILVVNTKILNNKYVKNLFWNELENNNILFLDLNKIQKITAKEELISHIEIKKKYPNTIIIKVFEKEPIAIYFDKKKFYYITKEGDLTDYFKSKLLNSLPNVIGSKEEFMIIFKSLKDLDFPLLEIESLHQHAIGRWDILLKNKKLIKLPKKNFKESIQNYIEIHNDPNFKKYSVFDFRVKDQLILK